MTVKEGNFIFRRSHRQRTYISSLAILPLLLSMIAGVILQFTQLSLAEYFLVFLLTLPHWLLAIIWILLPIMAVVLAHQAYKRGTLHRLHGWNRFVFWLSLALLGVELLVVLSQFL